MTPTADQLLDRRRLRRSLTRWRVFTAFAVIGAIGIGAYALGRDRLPSGITNHVARVTISGVITGNRSTLEMLDRLSRSLTASAVVVAINSPGGTVPGSEALYLALRRLAEKKPTVAVIGSTAASGGYIAAIGTDRIFARQTSIVGSIGVIFQYPDVTRLLDTIGVKVEQVKSAPLKAEPSGLTPTTEEARAAMRALVGETFEWFKALVKDRRGLDDGIIATVSDGRVFSGRRGVELKLVDAIGDEKDAIAWLVANKGVTADLPVRDWRPGSSTTAYGFWSLGAAALRVAGLAGWAEAVERTAEATELLSHEGLLAVWQPRPRE